MAVLFSVYHRRRSSAIACLIIGLTMKRLLIAARKLRLDVAISIAVRHSPIIIPSMYETMSPRRLSGPAARLYRTVRHFAIKVIRAAAIICIYAARVSILCRGAEAAA